MGLSRKHCYESNSHWSKHLEIPLCFPKGEGCTVLMNELTGVEIKVTGIPTEQKSPFEEQNSIEKK